MTDPQPQPSADSARVGTGTGSPTERAEDAECRADIVAVLRRHDIGGMGSTFDHDAAADDLVEWLEARGWL